MVFSSHNFIFVFIFRTAIAIDGTYVEIELRRSEANVQPPTLPPSLPPLLPTLECDGSKFRVELMTDDNGQDNSWGLYDNAADEYIFWGEDNLAYESNTLYHFPRRLDRDYCLMSGKDYTFVLMDAQRDGICCLHGQGYFKLWLDGEIFHTGGEFSEELHVVAANAPSTRPTQSSSSCTDDSSFLFRGEKEKDCAWVGKGKNRIKIFCRKKVVKGGTEKVSDRCKKTCRACEITL